MSRVSGCLWLAVGLVLALLAGAVAFVTLQRATVSNAEGETILTSSVVVAAHAIPVGTVLKEADLTRQNFPSDAVPVGALKSVSDASGQITMVPLSPGEMLLTHHITQPDITGANLGFTLPEGQVAVTLAADDLMSRVQLVKPGDRVDILYSLEVASVAKKAPASGAANGATKETLGTEEKSQYTFGTLQGVTVVSVVRSGVAEAARPTSKVEAELGGPQAAPYAYLLALDPQDALALKYLRDAGAAMDLAVRNTADESDHQTQPVDLLYLIDKYELPVK